MILDEFGWLERTDDPAHSFYVYAWFCLSWGNIPFYVGKGHGNRYTEMTNRSQQFKALTNKFDCFPLILIDNLTEEQADYTEDKAKELLICEGMPLIDLEIKAKRRLAQRQGIAAMPVDENGRRISKKTGRGFGRAEKRPANFAEVYERQQRGELSLKQALAEVGVGRTRWYELAREK